MLRLRTAETLADVAPTEWNALVSDTPMLNPFLRHEFLSALMESGCASAGTGWRSRFLLIERDGHIEGAMPLFEKSHSWGEYVFDWAWAQTCARHGIAYYPKLLCAIPFTPVTGSRLLARTDEDRGRLLAAALEEAREYSSLHTLFASAADTQRMKSSGMFLRHTVQFHWTNAGYADFEAFLSSLTRPRRKIIRQERRRVREAGVTVTALTGTEITAADWDFFHRCYINTYAAHDATPYLSREFFLRIGATMPENAVLFRAERNGHPVATSLCMTDGERLYGRYWGSVEHIPLLHFECCYYAPIAYAIERNLTAFEGGAQGEHKLFRGLLPVDTLSAHWIAHRGMARAVEDFLEREAHAVARYVDELHERSPLRQQACAPS